MQLWKGASTMNDREKLREILEQLSEDQWQWFIAAALPVLQELTTHAQYHPANEV